MSADRHTATAPTLTARLCLDVLRRLVEATDLTEATTPDTTPGHPPHILYSPAFPEPVGTVRVFRGTRVAHAVYIGLTAPAIGLDSHMVFAFGPAATALPHFTLDSVAAEGRYAFHLDLVPRVDLAAHLTYMDHTHAPLMPWFERGRAIPGLSEAAIGPRQRALMSPWMLVHRATEDAFRALDPIVHAYLDHWLHLVDADLPAPVAATLADTDPIARDHALRAALFDPDVDPVWHQVARLVGDHDAHLVRRLLRYGPDHEPPHRAEDPRP
ncbi:hypothetical protein [Embleya scabrispora]|uniref:hypothetical protein n=1 Tax=Embleya scabrispora TaxID=159449 RepID=UPI000C7A842B|nr:hypothetical protein [Embleya scabrispora]